VLTKLPRYVDKSAHAGFRGGMSTYVEWGRVEGCMCMMTVLGVLHRVRLNIVVY
jgi:hypothetical protein